MGVMDLFASQVVDPNSMKVYDYKNQIGNAAQNAGQDREKNLAFMQALQSQMTGNGGPSVAQGQLNQSLAQNQANAASTIASQRTLNPGLAARLTANAQAQAGQQAAGQMATVRAQEQMGAQQQLGQALQGQTAADQGMFGTSGQLANGQNQNVLGAVNANSAATANNMAMVGGVLGGAAKLAAMAHGGDVPTDDPSRDTVPTMLSPGERVLPRSIADDPDRARDFVAALKEMDGGGEAPKGKKGSQEGLIKALRAKQSETEQRLHRLESAFAGRM